jgi:hypothetical protein
MNITIPFKRREYQKPLTDFIINGGKKAFALWHRRAGKDLCLWNLMIRMATQKKGLYFYFLPTYTQGKKILWDGITNDGMRFIDYIPEEILEAKNATEMKLTLKNGSVLQIIGTDHYDAIRGTNPVGCVFSEFAFQNPQAWEVVKPILKVNNGWVVFNTTPNGKNHAYEMFEVAKEQDDWFCERLTIEDTGVLTGEDVKQEIAEGMSTEMAQQEYYCSFDIGALGAIYARQIKELYDNNHICSVAYEKNLPVDIYLDLGRSDSTAIIFSQTIGVEIRIIDYYENTGEAVDHYTSYLRELPYQYNKMWLPHDAYNKRMEHNKSIEEQFKEAGFRTDEVPNISIENGIQEVRKLLPKCWIDKDKCKQLIRALENYHYEWDDVKKVFKKSPLHDWSSHPSDAMRYLAVSWSANVPEPNYDYNQLTKGLF